MHVRQSGFIFGRFGVKTKKQLKPPPSNHGKIAKTQKTPTNLHVKVASSKQCRLCTTWDFVSEWLTLGNSMKFFKEKNNHQNR